MDWDYSMCEKSGGQVEVEEESEVIKVLRSSTTTLGYGNDYDYIV